MKATDVFTPQRLPTVTLVKDHLEEFKKRFAEAVEEGGKLIRVVGPSKSGKTVFIKNMVGSDLALITGANIENADQLWMRALDAIGCDYNKSETISTVANSGQQVSGTVSGNVFVAKGSVGGSASWGQSSGKSVTSSLAVDVFQAVLREYAGSGIWIFIDDLHYIGKDIQTALTGQIKQAVESGVLIACAAVPFRSEDALRANEDLQGRIADFGFEYWREEELVEIARLGFSALNVIRNEEYFHTLAREAAGSPQLMQSLCLDTCRELGVFEDSKNPVAIPSERDFLSRVCHRVATSVDFTSTIDRMKSGPLTRGKQRTSYLLKDGSTADVYPIIVSALAVDPPILHFSYKELQTRVAAVCAKEAPHFPDPCFHIARIANEGHKSDKMDWDSENQLLNVRDPYLLFSIRWSS